MWKLQIKSYGNVVQMITNSPFSAKKTYFQGKIHCYLKEK